MTIEFSLPDIGEGLEEAEVVEWHVKPGDRIERDQPFVDILTDKAQTEMPAPGAGTVVSLGAQVGEVVKVGELLIVIEDDQDHDDRGYGDREAADNVAAPSHNTTAPAGVVSDPVDPPKAPTVDSPAAATATPTRRPKASPSTRKLAASLGIDLGLVTGTGPGDRILAADVQLAAARSTMAPARPAAPPPTHRSAQTPGPAVGVSPDGTTAQPMVGNQPVAPDRSVDGGPPTLGQLPYGTQPLRGIRRATAKAMDLSWSTIPHVTAMDELDATELMLTRSRAKQALGEQGAAVTPLALLMVAVARSLRRFPMMNATLDLDGGTIDVHQNINIGVAVASDRGLMVPIVHDADRLDVATMAAEVARLSAEARSGTIAAADLSGGTFTVTNYGSNGGYFAAPIIRPGESGIVGFGSITKRPIVIEDRVEARPVIPVVISADHRLIDGDVLSAFQQDLSAGITNAITLLFGTAG